jgi:thiol-disulfide isomerase/thioredoxin
LKDQLTQHYARESLPADAAHRLQALADADQGHPDPALADRHSGDWWSRMSALAAGIAVILSGTVLFVVITQEPLRQVAGRDGLTSATRDVSTNGSANGVVPRLVAVKFQAEGCPLAAAIEPVFKKLADKYCDKPVVFARLDVTDDASLKQSRNLACGLGIDWVYEGAYRSGMIKLVDREHHQVLATVTDREQLPDMENMLARAFP